jgi:hypothetical protein
MFSYYTEENCRAGQTLENNLKLTVQKIKDIYRMNMRKVFSGKEMLQEEQLRVHHDQHKGDAGMQLQLRFKDVDDTIFGKYLELLEKVHKRFMHKIQN